MKWILVGFLLAALIALPVAVRAQAGGSMEEKLRVVEDLLRRLEEARHDRTGPEFSFDADDKRVSALHDVSDLCARLRDFIAGDQEVHPADAEIDESQPLFGVAGDEGDAFFDSAEELMELITQNVRPGVWADDGGKISLLSETLLLVHAEPDVQAEVGSYLDSLRRSAGLLVTVSVRVLRGDPAGTPFAAGAMLTREQGFALLDRAEKGDGCRLAMSTLITGYSGQRVALYRGIQRAYLQDYDVEVAQEAVISDPIVNILQTGLSFDVRPVAGDGKVVLTIRAQFSAAPEPLRTIMTPSGMLQIPEQTFVRFSTTVTVTEDAFVVVAGGSAEGGWSLLLSASTRSVESQANGGAR
jgi:hypothetical protein